MIGADEIDSECRTEDEEDHHYDCQENNLSCEGGAAIDFDHKESKSINS